MFFHSEISCPKSWWWILCSTMCINNPSLFLESPRYTSVHWVATPCVSAGVAKLAYCSQEKYILKSPHNLQIPSDSKDKGAPESVYHFCETLVFLACKDGALYIVKLWKILHLHNSYNLNIWLKEGCLWIFVFYLANVIFVYC